MDLDKEVFTTFEAADICNANVSTIKNWIDRGELDAFKTPGGHHRIEQRELDAFLNRHGMPNPFATRKRKRILLVHPDSKLQRGFEEELGEQHHCDQTDEAVDALLKIGQWKPDVAVVDCRVEQLDIAGLCRRIREYDDLSPMELIVVRNKHAPSTSVFEQAGADHVVSPPPPTARELVKRFTAVLKPQPAPAG